MRLEPKAKPVRIRIKIGGQEYNTLSEVIKHFSLKELYPLFLDGRLERWLTQIHEYTIQKETEELKRNISGDKILDRIKFMSIFNNDVKEAVESHEEVPNGKISLILKMNKDGLSFVEQQMQSIKKDAWKAFLELEDREQSCSQKLFDNQIIRHVYYEKWIEWLNSLSYEEIIAQLNTDYKNWGHLLAKSVCYNTEINISTIRQKLSEQEYKVFINEITKKCWECNFDFATLSEIFRYADKNDIDTLKCIANEFAKKTNTDGFEIHAIKELLEKSPEALDSFYSICYYVEHTLHANNDIFWNILENANRIDTIIKKLTEIGDLFWNWKETGVITQSLSDLTKTFNKNFYLEREISKLISFIYENYAPNCSIYENNTVNCSERVFHVPLFSSLQRIVFLKKQFLNKNIKEEYYHEIRELEENFPDKTMTIPVNRLITGNHISYWNVAHKVVNILKKNINERNNHV